MSVRRLVGGLLVLMLGASACGQRAPAQSAPEGSPAAAPSEAAAAEPTPDDPETTPVTTPEPSAQSPGRFALEDCPVEDEAFCKVAVEAVNAIAIGDAEALISVSRPATFDCGGIPMDAYPQCATSSTVLEGYAFTQGSWFLPTISVLSERDYADRLDMMFAGTDPSFTDEYGDGATRILGVSQCGGAWTLYWTAAIGEAGAPAERVIGFLELITGRDSSAVFTEGVWISQIEFFEEVAMGEFSLDQVGCDGPATPWPTS